MYKHLYDVFKKWHCTDGKNHNAIYIYSDTHFADEEMKHLRKDYIGDEEQIKRINSKVGKNDTLIILGDIGDTSFVKKLRGYKVLIMGNHDKGATNYQRKIEEVKVFSCKDLTVEATQKILNEVSAHPELKDSTYSQYFHNKVIDNHLFDEVYEGPLMVNDRLILSHEPIEGLPKYIFNIHGHDHSNWTRSDHHMNMCAEYINYTPVSLISLLKTGLLKGVDSIHEITIDNATERKAKRAKKAKEEKLNEVRNDSN